MNDLNTILKNFQREFLNIYNENPYQKPDPEVTGNILYKYHKEIFPHIFGTNIHNILEEWSRGDILAETGIYCLDQIFKKPLGQDIGYLWGIDIDREEAEVLSSKLINDREYDSYYLPFPLKRFVAKEIKILA